MPENYIKKIHLYNFKGFHNKKIDNLKKGINILIGDNDTGKSSVLLAVDLVLNASISKVDSIGLDRLINQEEVDKFIKKDNRKFEDLPEMEVNLYLSDQGRHEFEGEFNHDNENACGLTLKSRPNDEHYDQIVEVISSENPTFPYEYYLVEIKSFSGEPINQYKKPVRHISIDNTKISNDYASRSYVQNIYRANTKDIEQNKLKFGYRRVKEEFSKDNFEEINKRIKKDYEFALKSNSKANLETDLTIAHKGIDIENLGVGAQCFIRTSFALSKKTDIDVVLLEEPENHLSHLNMRRLIEEIKETSQSQIFVATHSSLVCSRLDLRSAILFTDFDIDPIKLDKLPEDTAKFFMKAPSNAILEFVLSKRNLLVEGDAEYILMSVFFKKATGDKLSGSGVNVISIGGLSFARYLDVANVLNIRTAVITDNDGELQKNCIDRYEKYADANHIQIFCDDDNERYTFEVCVYQDNKEICDELFLKGRRKLSVQEYMLKNKSTAAFTLASKKSDKITVPSYIKNAVKWVRE